MDRDSLENEAKCKNKPDPISIMKAARVFYKIPGTAWVQIDWPAVAITNRNISPRPLEQMMEAVCNTHTTRGITFM